MSFACLTIFICFTCFTYHTYLRSLTPLTCFISAHVALIAFAHLLLLHLTVSNDLKHRNLLRLQDVNIGPERYLGHFDTAILYPSIFAITIDMQSLEKGSALSDRLVYRVNPIGSSTLLPSAHDS